MKDSDKPQAGVLQLLERASKLISIVAGSETSLHLREISLRAGLSTTTTHRLLWSLQEKGWLTRDAKGRWNLGDEILALGQCARLRLALPMPEASLLQGLRMKTHANVFLSVRYNDNVLPLETDLLSTMPLHACTAGRVLLSRLHPPELTAYFERNPQASAQREALMTSLERAREFGWLQSIEDCPGKTLASAPILDPAGMVHASLTLLFDSEGQISPGELQALLDAAEAIGKSL